MKVRQRQKYKLLQSTLRAQARTGTKRERQGQGKWQ